MGQLENHGAQRKRKRDLKYALLAAVKITALTGIALAAPNLPQALYRLGLIPKGINDRSAIGRARLRLIKDGALTRSDKGMRLTVRGNSMIQFLEAKHRSAKKPRWDGRWRVLVFDVPEYRKTIRDKIRRTLIDIGFERLQDSVWIYPYDCEDLMLLLKAELRIGKDVRYMIVDELEGDTDLRKVFKLPNH